MQENQKLILEMMGLTNQLRRRADAITAQYGGTRFTGMQGFIISFIYDRNEAGVNIYQRDIEKEFYISRSTASGILSLMEKNGLVLRLSVPHDARLKRLVLTEEAKEIQTYIFQALGQMDRELAAALTEEEQAQMIGYINKMWDVLGPERRRNPPPMPCRKVRKSVKRD